VVGAEMAARARSGHVTARLADADATAASANGTTFVEDLHGALGVKGSRNQQWNLNR
jgi:hypothetical protein